MWAGPFEFFFSGSMLESARFGERARRNRWIEKKGVGVEKRERERKEEAV